MNSAGIHLQATAHSQYMYCKYKSTVVLLPYLLHAINLVVELSYRTRVLLSHGSNNTFMVYPLVLL